MSQQNALPHLPNGMNIPQVQISAEPMMPGQKMITAGGDAEQDTNNQPSPQAQPQQQQQMVPHQPDRRYHRATQGIPLSERPQNNQQMVPHTANPPPMFSAQPRRIPSIRKPRDQRLQKDVYRLESGIDPVSVLSSRLESWRYAIKNLVSVFKKIVEVEEVSAKGWVGAGRTIEVPFPGSNGQFLQSGGIQDVWSAIRDYSNEHGILHRQFATYVGDTLIPSLRAVKSDIKKMLSSIHNDKQLKSTEIFNSRMKVDKNIARLDRNIQTVDRSPQSASQCTDPFLVNLAVIHAIRELCDHENRLHDSALSLQREVGVFEQKIIENCRFIMQNLQNFRLEHKMEDIENIGLILQTFDTIQPFTEWNDFIKRNQYSLVMEDSAYKTEDSVQYPNQQHKYVRATKIGQLSTKQGSLSKSWIEGIYIITPAGFLHGYKTPQYFQTHPTEPTISIFIPDTTIIPGEGRQNSFTIKSKSRGKSRRSSIRLGSFSGSSHTFLARSQEESSEWQEALRAISARFEVVPLINSQPVVPPAHQQNRNLAPLPDHILPPAQEIKPAGAAAPQQPTPYDNMYVPGYTQFHFNQAPPDQHYAQQGLHTQQAQETSSYQPPIPQQQQHPTQLQSENEQAVPNVATVDHTGTTTSSIQTAIPISNQYQQVNGMGSANVSGMEALQNPSISPYDILNMASSGMGNSSVPSTGEYADPSLSDDELQHLNVNRDILSSSSSSEEEDEEEEELSHENESHQHKIEPEADTMSTTSNESSGENWQSVNEYSDDDGAESDSTEHAEIHIQQEYDPEKITSKSEQVDSHPKVAYKPGLSIGDIQQEAESTNMDKGKQQV